MTVVPDEDLSDGETRVIVRVNGAFGSGKTTLVEELRRRWPEALVYDPETVGYVLREIVEVPTGDFQDLRLWRRQVVHLAVGLVEEYRKPVLVPMTLINAGYVTPDSPEQDERVRQWCKSRIESCTAAMSTLPSDTVFLDGELTTTELADDVLARVGGGSGE
ncbi:TmrB-like protein [Streptomyces sp. P01-B04]|uniref:AAA family ATPase n=1 Tax=Streptomyces TaxID=1883 RepID=UPI001C5F284F|nr:AAA family ATPase [Streptomyces poriferorum]MBW5254627.1 TmrB-like protein [Streptomyces poriferorum]MBW5262402.1 TmrB-like protein [Streptomyces poriferorum]